MTSRDDQTTPSLVRDDAARLRDLVRLGPPDGTSVAAIRALCAAHVIPLPSIARACAQLDLQLDGDRVIDPDPAPASPVTARDRHLQLARAIRAGLLDPAAILTDLAWHATLGAAGTPCALVADTIALALATDDADRAFDAIERALALLADRPDRDDRTFVDLHRQLAELAGECGRDDVAAFAAWQRAAEHAHEPAAAARARYRRSFLTDTADRRALLEQLAADRTAQPGWSRRAAALLAIDADDHPTAIADDRAAVLAAVASGDRELEASALLALSNLTGLHGDLRTALALQERGATIGHRAGAWRPAVIGQVNLAWLALDQLDLERAERAMLRLSAIASLHGIAIARVEAALLDTGIASVVGDAERARRALARLDQLRATRPDLADSFDAAWLAMRELDARVAAGDDDADHALRTRVTHLAREHGDETIELELYLAQARLAADVDAFSGLVDRLEGGEATFVSLALLELATATILTPAAELRTLLATAIDRCGDSPAPVLGRAIEHARHLLVADTDVDVDALEQVAVRWNDAGMSRAAALAWAAAGCAAAVQGRGERAAACLDRAHRQLARLGSVRDLQRVTRARDRAAGIGDAARRAEAPTHRVDLLDELEDDDLRLQLEARLVRRRVAGGERVFLGAKEDARAIAWIRSGVVAQVDSRARTTALHGPGRVLGIESVVLDAGPSEVSLLAVGPCELAELPAAAFESLSIRHGTLALAAARAIARVASEPPRDVASLPLRTRLARCVLHAGDQVGWQAHEDGDVLARRVGRSLLGELAGASREAVSRELAQLVDAGILDRAGQRLVVRDRAALARIAGATDPAPHGRRNVM